jgi:hypothetical protein
VAAIQRNANILLLADLRQRGLVPAAAGAVAAFLLGWAAFILRDGDMAATRAAANSVLGASSIVFALYFLSRPLSRLIRARATAALGRGSGALAGVFAGMQGVFLLWVSVPYVAAGEGAPLPTVIFVLLSAVVLGVFYLGATGRRFSQTAGGRTVQRLAVAYFWLAFVAHDVGHMSAPGWRGHFYDAALSLLSFALLVRLGDALLQKSRAAMSGEPF